MEIETIIIIAAIGFLLLFAWYMYDGLTNPPRIELIINKNISEDNLRSMTLMDTNSTSLGQTGRICGIINSVEICE